MLKNFINRFKGLVEQNKENKECVEKVNNNKEIEKVNSKEIYLEEKIENSTKVDSYESKTDVKEIETKDVIIKEDEITKEKTKLIKEVYIAKEEIKEKIYENKDMVIEKKEIIENVNKNEDENVKGIIKIINNNELDITKEGKVKSEELTEEDKTYIKDIKIKRGKDIKAIDIYTKEPQIFKTHKDCSKKLRVPLEYIKENLKYGHTDYVGEAIKYLNKELNITNEEYINYLDSSKNPYQILSLLNNKIFTTKISEEKRDEILCNEKIEPIKMHYTFEFIDKEYDDYFKTYKSIIKRGGKKKIELVDKNGEVIDIFKSLDDCADFLGKEKNEIVSMLKYKDTKVGRNEIRYSLRNI